ncbi:electron transport complex subunit RsxC [bacterium]|nr:electron transport complex subunit RsxC [bacterium]
MNLRTFKIGGIHPPENKLSAGAPIEAAPVPEKATIPLSQHIGAPAVPVIKKGDTVKVGTLIGKGESFISANIHSSVSGIVTSIDSVDLGSGYKVPSVVIKVEGDEWEENIDRSVILKKEITLNSKEIVQRIKDAGIVGLGGATFPTHVKYMVPEGKKIDAVIINAVECEPYLTADHRLMLERPQEILVGIEILKKALGVETAIIGIEINKRDAYDTLARAATDFPGTRVEALKVQYPQGAEKQLIKAVLNREVPSGKLPLDVGCVVNNVGTAFAVYEAVQKNKPLIARIVTITGKHLETPANYFVRVGTMVNTLVEKSGGMPEDIGKIINGGPMMGKAVTTYEIPVTKGTSGLILVDKEESSRRETTSCIRCAKCVTVCPMGLEPYLLEKLADRKRFEDMEELDAIDCIECGSCSYVCPSSRPLLDLIRLGKANINRLRRERSKK